MFKWDLDYVFEMKVNAIPMRGKGDVGVVDRDSLKLSPRKFVVEAARFKLSEYNKWKERFILIWMFKCGRAKSVEEKCPILTAPAQI